MKGGKKFKKGKKQSFNNNKLIYKDVKEDQEYGKVITCEGNRRFNIQCFDGVDRLGILAGNMKKRLWINKDDIVLISRWDFTTKDNKCSIIHKYEYDEVTKLKQEGEFPNHIKLESECEFQNYNDEEGIKFNYDELSDSGSENNEDVINLDEI
tara:strand:- start:47 stop:505 length:459 start_codon:yes stop_codon:yes gene_type:complete